MENSETYPGARVLLADDEPDVLGMLQIALGMLGVEVTLAHDGTEAVGLLQSEPFDLVICDVNMPGLSGMEVLRASRQLPAPPLFILITGDGKIEMAVEAMRAGALNFLEKPLEMDKFTGRVRQALDSIQLAAENRNLRRVVESQYVFSEIIGNSKALRSILDLARRASEQPTPVLLLGESGTGKDLMARAIHFHGSRQKKPFIPINCGAIPENLIESEFFGHKRGSFTGAVSNRRGCFEEVAGGTLFLDEIGEMPLEMQVKLLRVLEEHKIRRIGENAEIPVDFRVIAATNRSLSDLVRSGRFRQDLYYRLHVLTIQLPALRERPQDIVPLVRHFLRKAQSELKTQVRAIDPLAMDILQGYEFPGNVRELINILQRAILLCDSETLLPVHLPPEVLGKGVPTANPATDGLNLKEATLRAQKAVERRLIPQALAAAQGNYKKAAGLLGISRGSLYNKLERHAPPD